MFQKKIELLIPYLSKYPLIRTQKKMFFTLHITCFSGVKITPDKNVICNEKNILGTPASFNPFTSLDAEVWKGTI